MTEPDGSSFSKREAPSKYTTMLSLPRAEENYMFLQVRIGLVASGELYAARLNGNVTIRCDLTVCGKKSAAVAFPYSSHRLMYCVESPESWFEDFGFAQLVNGEAHVGLDPCFVSVMFGCAGRLLH